MSQIVYRDDTNPWPALKRLSLTGAALILVFIGGLGGWSLIAPLMSAAIASGTVVVESHRKTVQHLEGGIIGAILVKDGDRVEPGTPLLELNDTKARTSLQALNGQLWDAVASEARLSAELQGAANFVDPPELVARSNSPAVARVLAGQHQIAAARSSSFRSKSELVTQRIRETREEILGLENQKAVAGRQQGFIKDELSIVQQLADKGLERRTRYLQLQGSMAEAEGKVSAATAQISKAEQTITEAQMSIANMRYEAQKEAADELREAQRRIHELREKVEEAAAVMTRTVVRAPEAGIVTDLRVHTTGGVIAAGDPLLDLVPEHDRTVVEAQVRPEDINVVRAGLRAKVRLLPYQQRRTAPLDGEVAYVSADRMIDKNTNRPYYAATIRVSEQQLRSRPEIDMRPGMPSEVTIETGATTFAVYALSPLIDSLRRAGIER